MCKEKTIKLQLLSLLLIKLDYFNQFNTILTDAHPLTKHLSYMEFVNGCSWLITQIPLLYGNKKKRKRKHC